MTPAVLVGGPIRRARFAPRSAFIHCHRMRNPRHGQQHAVEEPLLLAAPGVQRGQRGQRVREPQEFGPRSSFGMETRRLQARDAPTVTGLPRQPEIGTRAQHRFKPQCSVLGQRCISLDQMVDVRGWPS